MSGSGDGGGAAGRSAAGRWGRARGGRAAGRACAALFASLALIAGLPRAASAQAERADRGDAGWTVDDVLLQETAADYRVSPGGEWVVWVRRSLDRESGKRRSHLWLSRTRDGESWPLTRGEERSFDPRWSPDGSRIAFLSTREADGGESDGSSDGAGPQLWVMRLRGGEPRPVTSGMRGIRDFGWKGRSSEVLVVAAREEKSRYEAELEEHGDDARVVEDTLTHLPVRLWRVRPGDESPRRLTENDDWIRSLAVSPGGDRAVVVAGNDLSFQFDGVNPPHTYLVDLETGERRQLFDGEEILPRSVQWAPGGSGFYVSYPYSSHPEYRTASVTRMAFYELSGDGAAGELQRIDLDWDRQLGAGFRAVRGGFVAFLADGIHYRPALYRRRDGGWRRRMIRGEHVPRVYDASVSEDGGRVAYTSSAADRPPQPYVARLEGARMREPVQLDTLNPAFARKPVPRVETVRWEGARGDTVEGLLYYPLGYREGRRCPLILNIHGGPASQDMDRWSQSWADPIVLLNQEGAFVLQVNYHGSGNYGLEWVESIGEGKYYELEIPDIESGVDYLIRRGLVHPDSVATQGWSNGAILSNRLTVENPDRYRASLAGAGDVEWISDWGNIDFGATFDNYYFGAPPYEAPQKYIEKSPFFRLEKVRTPTLIFFGTEDRNVPTSQGWSHFRALQQIGRAPVRFVLFPGEAHGLDRLEHQRRKVEEELRWLDRHLWGREPATNLALADDSPLARALRLRAASRGGDGLYGRRVDGTLVPETVPHPGRPGLEVGRFEVTRAQWRAYDPDYRVPAGGGNRPVSGVDYREARRYAAWLREVTGREYRLPRREELEPLAEKAPAGNTLDHWAGYAPNPDDRARLLEAAAKLPGPAPLAVPVGSFRGLAPGPGSPDAPAAGGGRGVRTGATGASVGSRAESPGSGATRIYGLNGNVAEWVAGDDGGSLVGGSADRPAGAGGARGKAGRDYRGLRVVLETVER